MRCVTVTADKVNCCNANANNARHCRAAGTIRKSGEISRPTNIRRWAGV